MHRSSGLRAPAPSFRRWLAVPAAALCLVPMACSGDDGGASASTPAPATTDAAQPLTAQQAELLASMRLVNYQGADASFTASVDVDAQTIRLHGVVDWQQHVGSAVFTTDDRTDANSHGLMQWNFDTVSAHPGGDVDGPPPPPPSDGTWIQRSIDPTTSALDTLFLLLLNLGASQPENPQLLRQSDARFLNDDVIGGEPVSVFRGPSSDAATDPGATSTTTAGESSSRTTFWVGVDGRLLRFQAELGLQTVTVEFTTAPDVPTQYLPDLLTAAP